MAGHYAHARQFKRLLRVIKRQRTIVARMARLAGLSRVWPTRWASARQGCQCLRGEMNFSGATL